MKHRLKVDYAGFRPDELRFMALTKLQDLINEYGKELYSQNQVAKWLKTTPQTLINWKKKRGDKVGKGTNKYMSIEEIIFLIDWLLETFPFPIFKFLIPYYTEERLENLRRQRMKSELLNMEAEKLMDTAQKLIKPKPSDLDIFKIYKNLNNNNLNDNINGDTTNATNQYIEDSEGYKGEVTSSTAPGSFETTSD